MPQRHQAPSGELDPARDLGLPPPIPEGYCYGVVIENCDLYRTRPRPGRRRVNQLGALSAVAPPVLRAADRVR